MFFRFFSLFFEKKSKIILLLTMFLFLKMPAKPDEEIVLIATFEEC